MRREPEHFGDQELDLIYVARKLKDAERLEDVLTAGGVDYVVEADRYGAGFILRTERIGAFFYVAPDVTAFARTTMTQGGFKPFAAQAPPRGGDPAVPAGS